MFELIYDPIKAEKKPWDVFLWALVITFIAIWLSPSIAPQYTGLSSVILITFAFFPLLFKAFNAEEEEDKKIRNERDHLYHHRKIVALFIFIFLGSLAAFFISYHVLPSGASRQLFDAQLATLKEASPITAHAVSNDLALATILKNNLTLLVICLGLSLLFGLGSLFLMIWNSSVIGIAMAFFVKENMTTSLGSSVVMSSLRYLLHGLPEMTAFFIASLGGAIISVAVLKHDLQGEKGKGILKDGLSLVGASIALLMLSALIEVFLTPYVS